MRIHLEMALPVSVRAWCCSEVKDSQVSLAREALSHAHKFLFIPPWHPKLFQSHALHPLPHPGCKFPATQKAGIRPIIPSSSKLTNPSGSALPCTKHLWLKGKLCKACLASQGNSILNSLSSEWPGQEMLCQVSF